MKTRIVGLACAAVLCGGVPVVSGEPISIRSGLISTDFTKVSVSLDSGSFSVFLIGLPGTFRMANEAGFHAGETIDFSATANGIFFTNDGSGQTVALDLSLMADPAAVTTTADRFGLQSGIVQTPFRMTGTVAGTTVTGSGALSLRVGSSSSVTPALLDADSADFRFSSSTPALTPEPASVLLLITGVLGIMVRRVLM